MAQDPLKTYLDEAERWSDDRERASSSSRRTAWIIATIASAVAVFEAIALLALAPLKTVVPYTLLVDRQTGYVQQLKPLEQETISPDSALVRSFLAQYVIAREGFDIDSLQDDYRKIVLWTAGDAQARYVRSVQASNPKSALATLPRRALVEVQIRSISSLSDDTALIRYTTMRTDPGSASQAVQSWAAVIKYQFSGKALSAQDRLLNPIGFQVTRYRRNSETQVQAVDPVQSTSLVESGSVSNASIASP